jgi:acetyl-CoA synthetase
MEFKSIKKPFDTANAVQPNLQDYEKGYQHFSWKSLRRELDGLPGGKGLNIAHEAVDRHASGPNGGRLAIRWLGEKGEVLDFTYRDLRDESNRFANVLQHLGVRRGERIFVLTGRIPDLYVAALGTWKRLLPPILRLWAGTGLPALA